MNLIKIIKKECIKEGIDIKNTIKDVKKIYVCLRYDFIKTIKDVYDLNK